ncbi:hypothetical protein BBJ28_00004687 [Nothophytophthora sp. Chile5]|nr:hypothetical protein BBJ28_00004687 [Nothophytophthora sp. Chile5]
MGKSTTTMYNEAAEQEFNKLEQVLNQTAGDTASCLKVLKGNLSEYDSRHGLHFTNTSKSFLRSDIRAAKDSASELKHVANQIRKSKEPSESEIMAARNKMNATSDAMTLLKKTARAYDEKNGKSTGITGMIDNVLINKDGKEKEKESEGSWFSKNKSGNQGGVLGTSDTVEAVVKSTLRDSFAGFTVLKHQITTAEKALTPSLADRAKEAVLGVADKLKGDSKTSPTHGRP